MAIASAVILISRAVHGAILLTHESFWASLSAWTVLSWLAVFALIVLVVNWCAETLNKRFGEEAEKRAADDKTAMLRISFLEERLTKLEKR